MKKFATLSKISALIIKWKNLIIYVINTENNENNNYLPNLSDESSPSMSLIKNEVLFGFCISFRVKSCKNHSHLNNALRKNEKSLFTLKSPITR